jgi:hypothetical protein
MICADGFNMADEAFALSPISARAAQPREEDYEAIREAFMETSRGRWFLDEYAKRNRNADTRMVLDAVARIEETLTAERQPAPEPELAEVLNAIKSALEEARSAASASVEKSNLEDGLAPVRKGARIIGEISWRWREIGADARICDLIDSQVGAIEEASGQISATDPSVALKAALDLIEQRIEQFGDRDRSVPPAAETAETHATAEAMDMKAEFVSEAAEAADMTAEAAEAHDEAILDIIALEMAAPDPADVNDHLTAATDRIWAAEALTLADPDIVAQRPAPIAGAAPPLTIQPPRQPPEHSLGSTLIESGIVRRPGISQQDPLAAIRRMSQAEKIALFS